MRGSFCILCCEHLAREVAAVLVAEAWSDVVVVPLPPQAEPSPLTWRSVRARVGEACTGVAWLGCACREELGAPPADWLFVRRARHERCEAWVTGEALLDDALRRGLVPVLPGRLADGHPRPPLPEGARELLLLDTGVDPEASRRLDEWARATALPGRRLEVGLDPLRAYLGRAVTEWRLERERLRARDVDRGHAQELADSRATMDFVGRLALFHHEREALVAIEDMFRTLFAPREVHVVHAQDGALRVDDSLAPALRAQLEALHTDWAWIEDKTGFLLRIERAGELLGVVAVVGLAFPEHRHRYVNLALALTGVAGLAIDIARTYRRIKEAEESLRKGEQSLRLAQAMAHLGHWELDVSSGESRWSDETFRILGHEPDAVVPSYEAFCQCIHPEDRARVMSDIAAAQAGRGFDLEFRVALPDGRVRVVHGMGEVMHFGAQPQLIGSIRALSTADRPELLGVIQDITGHKELQWKLEQEAHTDALTGCANRRHFLSVAERELARARRYGEEVSVLMLDLDHFKQVNDQHGHEVGDRTLQRLVQACQATLRGPDVVGRLGGEEFAVLLPETGQHEALELAQRLRLAVAGAEVPMEGKPPLRVTASFGVATLAAQDVTIATVLGRADRALYEAKRAGRDRVVA